ncbi:divalent metal cation transporter [Robertkochia solimangrovi]|nr:Nramp family divalent metal transporter [Robertkochia solimangrovi]TRZ42561.1 divalent metal cation transporter [Robertkochia solimangrovi]
MLRFLKNIGPGTLIAAAFIGPGTVTVCTLAGVRFGYSLIWAMILSIVATIILQEMSSRVGILTGRGLSEVIKSNITNRWVRLGGVLLILSAIVIGNTAYEAGNISGAALGMEALLGKAGHQLYPFIIGGVAFLLLAIGNYRFLEKSLVGLVLLMSISFVITAVMTGPDFLEILRGIFMPEVNDANILTIAALVGTTVVPYNLFLHASLVRERWNSPEDLKASRIDTLISVLLGGLVSVSIIICAAAVNSTAVNNVMELAMTLEPLYGSLAKYFLGIGLFAAGITSAITAPLAAAYVANGCFGWNAGLKDIRFKTVWGSILIIGILVQTLGLKPIQLIQFAQVANGILLPVIVVFLYWIVNKKNLLGNHVNSKFQNIITFIIVLVSVFLGLRSILKVWELF